MSTLKVNDIVEATSGGGKIWPARAWANINMSGTYAIRNDKNVSSLTDLGTGTVSVVFSNAAPNATYAAPSSAGDNTIGHARIAMPFDGGVISTTAYRIRVDTSASDATDVENLSTSAIWA